MENIIFFGRTFSTSRSLVLYASQNNIIFVHARALAIIPTLMAVAVFLGIGHRHLRWSWAPPKVTVAVVKRVVEQRNWCYTLYRIAVAFYCEVNLQRGSASCTQGFAQMRVFFIQNICLKPCAQLMPVTVHLSTAQSSCISFLYETRGFTRARFWLFPRIFARGVRIFQGVLDILKGC